MRAAACASSLNNLLVLHGASAEKRISGPSVERMTAAKASLALFTLANSPSGCQHPGNGEGSGVGKPWAPKDARVTSRRGAMCITSLFKLKLESGKADYMHKIKNSCTDDQARGETNCLTEKIERMPRMDLSSL